MKKILYYLPLMVFLLSASLTAKALHHIPTVYITTADGKAVTSREEWKKGTTLRIILPDSTVAYEAHDVSVKSRGHSTFTKPKKPYAIKLAQKSSLLGMKADRRWVLLANFMDHSNVRNSLALAIAKQASLNWTPDSRLVDVVLNGQLQGCYLLSESVEVRPYRIPINDGGFLVEGDSYADEDQSFRTTHKRLPLTIKYPEELTPQQIKGIESYFDEIEKLLYTEDTNWKIVFKKYIDKESFADWWIIHELTQNAEPNGPRSCYMHKTKNGLLKMGPVWDFDLAFINVGLDGKGDIRPSRFHLPNVKNLTGDSLYNHDAMWYGRLFDSSEFVQEVKNRWKRLKPRFERLTSEIDNWKVLLKPSAIDNDSLWQGQDPARFDIYLSFDASIENLKKVYEYRLKALNKLIGDL